MFQLFYLYIINFPDLFYDILGLFDWLFHSVEHCCECLSLYLSTFTTTFMVPANRANYEYLVTIKIKNVWKVLGRTHIKEDVDYKLTVQWVSPYFRNISNILFGMFAR